VGNRERIIEASLELFNARGVRSVTTNRISAHISISSGNLYYHFRNKEEIIREIFPRIADAARSAIRLPEEGEITAAHVGRYHLAGIRSLWEYRFFFRDLTELLSRDPTLAKDYRKLQRWLIGRFVSLFQRLASQGHMNLRDFRDDIERVATIAVILWTSWVNFEVTSRAQADLEPDDIAQGALHGFLVFAPYLTEQFVAEVRAAIRSWAMLNDGADLAAK
jgi:AcrR family transcriptional regulator